MVALLADSETGYANLGSHLIVNRTGDDVAGTATIINGSSISNIDAGHSYYVGNLPWYQRIWYHMLKNPWLLFISCVVSAMLLCWLIYRLLRHWRSGRLSA